MEKWIIDNAMEIVVLVLGFLWAFVQLDRFQKDTRSWRGEMVASVKKMAQDLDTHIASDNPHKACPAHYVKIEDALTRMDRIQTDIRELRSEIAEYNRGVMALAVQMSGAKTPRGN